MEGSGSMEATMPREGLLSMASGVVLSQCGKIDPLFRFQEGLKTQLNFLKSSLAVLTAQFHSFHSPPWVWRLHNRRNLIVWGKKFMSLLHLVSEQGPSQSPLWYSPKPSSNVISLCFEETTDITCKHEPLSNSPVNVDAQCAAL